MSRGASLPLLAVLVLSAPARALDPSVPLSHYVRETWQEALPQATVHSVLQTRDGYLWLGTYEGLVRFNGVAFRVWDRSSTPAMKSSAVWTLLEDRAGTLWAGTIAGGLIEKRGEQLRARTTADGLLSDSVYSLLEDRAGDLWVGTIGGVHRLHQGRLEAFGRDHGFGARPVRALAETPDGAIWAGTDGDGLFRFESGRWQRVPIAAGLGGGSVNALRRGRDGTLWAGTYAGLQRWDGKAFEVFGTQAGLTNPRIWAVLEDRDGSLWAGTEGGGLQRLRDGRFEALGARDGLPSDVVRCLEEDREGNLWVGSNGGLTRLRPGTFAGYTARHGLGSEFVRVVLEDHLGQTWAGTDGGGLARLNGHRFVRVPLAGGPGSDLIRALAEDRDGNLWVGTAGAGLARFRDGQVRFFGTADGLTNGFVRSLLAASDGALWIGTNSGLNVLRAGAFSRAAPAAELDRTIVALAEGQPGTIWAGTSTGGLFAVRDGRAEAVGRKQGLPTDAILSLLPEADGSVWIGSQFGLCRIRGGRVQYFGRAAGLPEEAIFSILDDGLGQLWLSSNHGVLRVERADLEAFSEAAPRPVAYRAFGRPDGMPSRQCNGSSQPAGFHGRDGRLWYATAGGVAVVDPRRLVRNADAPPVVVETFLVDGRPVSELAEPELPAGTRRIEIGFAALSFSIPERVKCRFRLEGFDDAWRDAGTQRRVEYTALSPGRYRFRVIAANEDGVWNESGASFGFRLRPWAHQTAWFWALVTGGTLTTGTLLLRARVRGLRARERELERLVAEKTRDLVGEKERAEQAGARLAEANRMLEVVARLDPLTGIANRRRFEEALDAEWRRALRAGEQLALVVFDVDQFKAYNDAFGHLAGDECLRRIAATLAAGLRRGGDLLARWGGEEFAALMPATGPEEAAERARELLARIEALSIPHLSPPSPLPVVSASAGVAAARPALEAQPASLVEAADVALYEAKRRGRRQVVTAGERP